MCGIVGVAGFIGPDERKVFTQLLEIDVIRGPHATGVVIVDNEDNVKFEKRAVPARDFIKKNELNLNGIYYGNKVLLGHNRYATVGKIDCDLMAHPFDYENVIGVHNGTLEWGWTFSIPDGHKFDSDSQALYSYINSEHNNINNVYNNVEGAMALSWFDKVNGTINFVRNNERPLYFTFSEDEMTLFWASEDWMLSGILGRNQVKHTKILQFEIDCHYSIDPSNLILKKSKPVFRVKKLTPAPKRHHHANFMARRGNVTPLFRNGQTHGKISGIGEKSVVKDISFEILGVDYYNSVDGKRIPFFHGQNMEDGRVVKLYKYEKNGNNVKINRRSFRKNFKGKVCLGQAIISKETITVISSTVEVYDWSSKELEGKLFNDDEGEAQEMFEISKGEFITEMEFLRITETGCSSCLRPIEWGDRFDLYWEDDEPVCKECCNNYYYKIN